MSRSHGRSHARRSPPLEFRLLIALGVAIFLVAEALSRLVPPAWRADKSRRGSILHEARAAAHRTIPLAFMG